MLNLKNLKTYSIFLDSLVLLSLPYWSIDSISKWLIGLVLLIIPTMILKTNNLFSLVGIIILGLISIFVFYTTNLLTFYIAYEALLIPSFYLIGFFGSRQQKLVAIYEFFIYTLIGSFLLLVGILLIYLETGSFDYKYFLIMNPSLSKQVIIFILIFAGFAVKIPFIPVHLWLPKAHVESPTEISVYLAAILLKFSIYGYIRTILPLCFKAIFLFQSFIIVLSVFGLLYTSLLCISITYLDIKKIIAYSSVSHMNLANIILFSFNLDGVSISLFFLLSHGIISSGLFFLIGFLYDRYHTRIVSYFKGIVLLYPVYSLFFLFFSLANTGFPFTIGFISEILSFFIYAGDHYLISLFLTLSILFTPSFNIYLLHQILYGSWSNYLSPSLDLSLKEFNIFLPLFFISILFGIYPNIIFDTL